MTLTYSLTNDDSGKFAVSGSNLNVAGAILPGSHTVVVRATDGNGWMKDKTFTLTVNHVASASNAYIIIFAGQSNNTAEGSSGYLSGTNVAPTVPPLYSADSSIKIWDSSTSAWVTYVPGTNSVGQSNKTGYASQQWWGPEYEFARRWRLDNPTKTLYIVKHAVGGTSLDQGQSPNWHPATSSSLYAALKAKFDAAKANIIAASGTPIVMGLVWAQGETEASTGANNYATNLQAFITAVRTDMIGSTGILIVQRIPYYAGQTGQNQYQYKVAQAQYTVVSTNQPAVVQENYDATFWPDGYHYQPTDLVTNGALSYAESIMSGSFLKSTGVAVGSTVTSETLTIRNIISTLPVTVSGCTWSKNGGSYTSSAGTVSQGDTVTIQATASASNDTVTLPSITIGNATLVKRIKTIPAVGTGLDGTESDGTNRFSGSPGVSSFLIDGSGNGWSTGGYSSTLQAATQIASDGTLSAAEMRIGTAASPYASNQTWFISSFLFRSQIDTTITTHWSIYVKPGENGCARYINMAVVGTNVTGTPSSYLIIDTTTWTVTDAGLNAQGTTNGLMTPTATIVDAKYGYKKITMAFTATPNDPSGGGYFAGTFAIGQCVNATLAAMTSASNVINANAAASQHRDTVGTNALYLWRPHVAQ